MKSRKLIILFVSSAAIQAQVSTSDTALGQVEGSNNVGKRPTRDPDPDSESDISPSKKPKYDGSLGHTFSLEDSGKTFI